MKLVSDVIHAFFKIALIHFPFCKVEEPQTPKSGKRVQFKVVGMNGERFTSTKTPRQEGDGVRALRQQVPLQKKTSYTFKRNKNKLQDCIAIL